MKPYLFLIVLILNGFLSFSQEGTEIKRNKQFYIYGSTAVIGNNIVSKHPTKPFNDDLIVNDEVRMRYVDIDEDLRTFSSSQATLTLPENKTNIVYAALYWSAVYKYDYGFVELKDNAKVYTGNANTRNPVVNTIKLKIPNQPYQKIVGNVIYDDFKKDIFEKNTPYACYADITDLLKNNSEVNGDYTVANIEATEGYISGGCSGGWLLYVVYEAPTENPVYVTTYNGFIQVNRKNHSDIVFKDFKTKEEGFVKTHLTLAALEGDNQLKTDQCLILNPSDSTYVALGNSLRKVKNIFNSKITFNDLEFEDRKPFSTNTLGFDILQMELPNPSNELVSNDVDQITMQIKTNTDRFYLFFTAFQTDISQSNYIENKDNEEEAQSLDSINNTIVEEKVVLVDTTEVINIIVEEKKELIPEPEIIEEKPETTTDPAIKSVNEVLRSTPYTIPSLQEGYYLVTNVFSMPANTSKWKDELKTKGHIANSFVNPKNNWDYVYVFYSEDLDEIYAKYLELVKLSYFQDIWISKVNLP